MRSRLEGREVAFEEVKALTRRPFLTCEPAVTGHCINRLHQMLKEYGCEVHHIGLNCADRDDFRTLCLEFVRMTEVRDILKKVLAGSEECPLASRSCPEEPCLLLPETSRTGAHH